MKKRTWRFKAHRNDDKIHYNAQGYHIFDHEKKNKRNGTKVTVITPVHNAEKYLRKTIDSVINQSIGMENIEYILIDDCSTDTSRDILLDYSSRFENIMVVFLKCNSGTPGKPRNIGIQLSTTHYVTFLDADDWLEPNGLEILYDILEETGDDYVVGKTIQVHANGTKIIGEHESCKERRRVSPYTIPHIFHHLGPRARMVRASVLKEHRIEYPEMKFAEDKQFFIDVLTHCHSISTTTSPIYFLNRLDNLMTRLSNQTNIMQKTNCNLKVIQHIMNQKLPIEKEKMILNRLYEYDSISRFFTTPHFQKTRFKQLYYYKFKKVLKTTKKLRYEIFEDFLQPMNKVAYELFCDRKYRELETLFEWDKNEKIKEVLIRDRLPYLVVPFLAEKYRHIKLPMYAIFEEDYFDLTKYCLHFKVYGDYLDSITDVFIKNGKDAFLEYSLPVRVDKSGNGLVEMELDELNQFPTASYSLYLRFNDYMKIHIKKLQPSQNNHRYQNRDFTFFNTVYSNVGFKINDAGA